METNIHNDVNACKTVEYTETVQEGLKANSGGITVGVGDKLEHGPSDKPEHRRRMKRGA